MRHRGPDDAGLWEANLPNGCHLGLAHRRLAILDLTASGHQPMLDESSGNAIVFNGEIYNHPELRAKLARRSYRSTSDTETLLAAYAEWGCGMLASLEGMFAFAIWDASERQLFLARDRLGKKPIYYAELPNAFIFASEIRALLAGRFVTPQADPLAIQSYLAFGSVIEPHTILKQVQILEPGQSLRIDQTGRVYEKRSYWNLNECFLQKPEKEGKEAISYRLEQAVQKRLISDVPLGAFLSGGIDSTAIVATMSRVSNRSPQTFCLDFEEGSYREGRYAAAVAAKYHCAHTGVVVHASDFIKALESGMAHMDQPTCDGMNTYFVSGLARKNGLVVALSGQGGDEVFAGYPSFRLIPRLLGASLLMPLAGGILHAAGTRLNSLSPRWQKICAYATSRDQDIYGAYAHQRGIFWDAVRRPLLVDGGFESGVSWLRQAVPQDQLATDRINQVSQLELAVYLRNTLIRDMDVFSMAHSLELRAPLLDHHLVELLAGYDGHSKLSTTVNKPLLVHSVRGGLPLQATNRPKGIFWFPWREWLTRDLAPHLESALANDTNSCERLGLRHSNVSFLYKRFRSGDQAVPWHQIWALYVLLKWADLHGVSI
jgi:asparagine synthase (glutamine-hydrolysing)